MINIIDCGYNEFIKQNKDKKVFCFGAGKQLSYFSSKLKDLSIFGIIDNYKGKKRDNILLNGINLHIISLESFVSQYDENCSVVITCLAFDEIVDQLDKIDKLDGMRCYISFFIQEYTECSNIKIYNKNISMIPKKIHYCWFGGAELPEEYKENIKTWKKYCPEYEIIRWDESNYDFRKNLFMSQAYDKKKWAFVSDYARVDILYQMGGIYLDADVEVLRNLDELLKWKMFCGFQSEKEVNWGAGFGSVRNHEILKELLMLYDELEFIKKDGTLNEIPCPEYQSYILKKYGFNMNGKYQQKNNVVVYPKDFFSPLSVVRGFGYVTNNSYSVHWYSASWLDSEEVQRRIALEDKIRRIKDRINCGPIKTSIIIPVYNTEMYLDDCIQSVINQTQTEIELILVDDGSTDRSGMIIDRYAKKYPFIRVIHQNNQKQGAARNAGLKAARGEYIYFIDSDDYIANNLLEICYQAAKREDLDFVMFDAETVVDKGYEGPEIIKNETYDRSDVRIEDEIFSGKEFWFRYGKKGGLYVCSCLFYISAEFLKRNELFFEPNVYYEDHEWSTKLYIKAQKIKYIPQKLHYRRVRNDSTMTIRYSDEHLSSCIQLIDCIVRQIEDSTSPDEMKMLMPNLKVYISRAKEIVATYIEEKRIESIIPAIKTHYINIQQVLKNISENNKVVELMLQRFICELQKTLDEDFLSNREKENNRKRVDSLYEIIFSKYSLNCPKMRVGIYGTGKMCNIFLEMYQKHIGNLKADIVFIETKIEENQKYEGYPIYNVNRINEFDLDSIIVASSAYQNEMIQNIRKYREDNIEIQLLPPFLGYMME